MAIQEIVKFFINIILLIVIISPILIFLHKGPKKYLWIIYILFSISSLPISPKLLLNAWYLEDTYNRDIQYDTAILLSGIVNSRWYQSDLSKDFPNHHWFGNFRALKAIQLYKNNKVKRILVGNDVHYPKIKAGLLLKDFAVGQGVDPAEFIIYGDVYQSIDEAKGIKPYINGNERVVLISTASHLRRAIALFNKQGIYPDSLSTNKVISSFEIKNLIPNSQSFRLLEVYFYEVIGYLGYYIKGEL